MRVFEYGTSIRSLPTRSQPLYRVSIALGTLVISSKPIGDFVAAIIEQQTACQAQLALLFWQSKKPAGKRLARLLHNERLDPRLLADAVLLQALHQLPKHGKVRLAIDWTIEADQHLLVVSLVMGVVACLSSIYWRAYDTSVLKGRTKTLRTGGHPPCCCGACGPGRGHSAASSSRLIWGFADVALFTLLSQLGVTIHHPGASRHPRLVPGQVAQVGAIAISGQ